MRTRRLSCPGAAAVLLAAGALLAGCGSATVDESEATETSVAPLERSASSSSAKASGESSGASTSTSENSSAGSSSQGTGDEPEDRGAREVSEIPAPAPEEGPNQDFLGAVSQGGVNTDGVEDQLIGAAQAACQGDTVTVPAVAGQLIEQGRSELSHEQLTQLITEQGRALCAG
ncbi:hypothetical protein [Corynebacterium sp. HMSC05E07]|uniref:hypothetical protein n=1 Tax=Corynebacterium sp. HMSC05E07 TaxID=1581117 RepID=UPI0008A46D38|nr:hypothetical protein [Corynebacterium sp. HMSC05E07]OFT58795.1 hypothetical protein HMPREF3149_10580 [Corynebacterium sp. HMSC05E07]